MTRLKTVGVKKMTYTNAQTEFKQMLENAFGGNIVTQAQGERAIKALHKQIISNTKLSEKVLKQIIESKKLPQGIKDNGYRGTNERYYYSFEGRSDFGEVELWGLSERGANHFNHHIHLNGVGIKKAGIGIYNKNGNMISFLDGDKIPFGIVMD